MFSLEPLEFTDLTGWAGTDAVPALRAFRRSALALLAAARDDEAPDGFGVTAHGLRPAADRAAGEGEGEARGFFERFFRPVRIRLAEAAEREGFLTGYYEPEIEASRRPSAGFQVPLLAPPPDLARVADDPRFPEGFARRTASGTLEPYPDRAAIESGLLRGRDLEIAWLASETDAFFVHIQGSARLHLPDGSRMRVGYAAKNGHRFTAIGRVLVARGELTLAEADMAGIRRWLAHAGERRARALLHENRSFIFFRELPAGAPGEGPVGAAGVALTAMGSIAVDGRLHRYGTPLFVRAGPLAPDAAPFAAPLVAQDTGSAIRGAARGDLFVGSGAEAGRVAGAVRHEAAFHVLLPKGNGG